MSEHKPNLVVILMSVIFLVLTLLGCSTVIGKRGAEQKVALLHIGPIGETMAGPTKATQGLKRWPRIALC